MSGQALKGRTAFVTGAASGLGEAAARCLARDGAAVVLGDVQVDKGEAIACELRVAGREALFVQCDVRKEADIQNAIERAVSEFGGLHIAYNNAGVDGAMGPTADGTLENWDHVTNVNLRGVWLCMKHEIPRMIAAGGGAIVNCASAAGLVGFANIPVYTASKHGVIGLTKSAALEYAAKNIRVNAVCPGVIETAMTAASLSRKGSVDALLANKPMGRLGQPSEIGEAVAWLASPAASFVTGQALAVDGGWTTR